MAHKKRFIRIGFAAHVQRYPIDFKCNSIAQEGEAVTLICKNSDILNLKSNRLYAMFFKTYLKPKLIELDRDWQKGFHALQIPTKDIEFIQFGVQNSYLSLCK